MTTKKTLEDIAAKTCEKLPLDITIFENEFYCSIKTDKCKYSNNYGAKEYVCHKKTYTFDLQIIK